MLAITFTNLHGFNQIYIVTMNTQLHSAIKATPYEVVFGMKASSETVPSLKVVEEPEMKIIQISVATIVIPALLAHIMEKVAS